MSQTELKNVRTVTLSDPAPTTSAVLLTAADTNRWAVVIKNAHASETMYIGPSGVTTGTGFPLVAGESFTDARSSAAWYGIMGSGTGDARVMVFA